VRITLLRVGKENRKKGVENEKTKGLEKETFKKEEQRNVSRIQKTR